MDVGSWRTGGGREPGWQGRYYALGVTFGGRINDEHGDPVAGIGEQGGEVAAVLHDGAGEFQP